MKNDFSKINHVCFLRLSKLTVKIPVISIFFLITCILFLFGCSERKWAIIKRDFQEKPAPFMLEPSELITVSKDAVKLFGEACLENYFREDKLLQWIVYNNHREITRQVNLRKDHRVFELNSPLSLFYLVINDNSCNLHAKAADVKTVEKSFVDSIINYAKILPGGYNFKEFVPVGPIPENKKLLGYYVATSDQTPVVAFGIGQNYHSDGYSSIRLYVKRISLSDID